MRNRTGIWRSSGGPAFSQKARDGLIISIKLRRKLGKDRESWVPKFEHKNVSSFKSINVKITVVLGNSGPRSRSRKDKVGKGHRDRLNDD